ncbi:unnamed protein product [Phytophthora fragariaefolia]|uniref:Unnamed protein product n=1 Tax=Phytophthora fragariaefolia TaxID=1490495 RepID=A0A9W6TQS4_9STRA|nr:unnamed protein product [Phytophthora fragariaefolia]
MHNIFIGNYQGNYQASGQLNSQKSPRKASSFPTMSKGTGSPRNWSEHRAHQEESKQQVTPSTVVKDGSPATDSQVDDVSLMLDFKGNSGYFSDDDSDGSSYSSVCSNDEHSPTPSTSSSITSSSPLLRHTPSDAGFQTLHSEASEHSPIDSIPRQEPSPGRRTPAEEEGTKPRLAVVMPVEKHLSPTLGASKLRATGDAALDSDDDLPDWLRERTVLSPPASSTKLPAKSPQQIEDEIRFAVDSAAARVQQELGRREQFQSALQSAAAYTGPQENNKSVNSKLFPGGGDSSKLSDNALESHTEKSVPPSACQEVTATDIIQGELLLLMEVVISDDRTETIEIHEGDSPDALASAFARQHALQPNAIPKLRGLIQDQLDALAESEHEETIQPAQSAADDWANDWDAASFVNSPAVTLEDTDAVLTPRLTNPPPAPQLDNASVLQQTHERENHREFSYNNLMARYGHYSQHSGKVDPEGNGARRSVLSEPNASYNMQATECTRTTERLSASSSAPAFTTMIHSSRYSNSKKKTNLADAPAYERLYALAESKDKWIQRAQKAKELEKARDEQRMHRVELMAAKSRELVANRTNGGYAHIGERLHDEALSDIAKKMQRHERRVVEREQQQDWMCPKCANVNQYSDSRCQNIVALPRQISKTHRGRSPTAANSARRGTASSSNSSFGFLESHPEVLCGQPKPDRLFQPTLLTTAANVMRAVSTNKEKSSRVASLRRQRHRSAIEEEFQQTCPFRPKINIVSEEIVREKHETAAAAAALHGEVPRPRNPHHVLYENSFQARAMREEQEEEYYKQFPFKPDIGVNTLWVAPDKSQGDFVERLAVDKYHEQERKRAALYDKYTPDRDPQTGKELFKPEIGRGPAFARNKQGLPIGDFLHAAHREQQEYHRQLLEKDQREIKKKSQQTFVSEASRQTLERRKADTCSRIFDALLVLSRQSETTGSVPPEASTETAKQVSEEDLHDTQQNECSEAILPARVDLSVLPAEISRVVAIVFEYANHTPITRDSFSKYIDRLVREVPEVSYSQIIFLAEYLHTDKCGRQRHQSHHSDPEREAALTDAEQKELTFHPVIDKNSREIATKHGRVSSTKVFQALNQYYDHYLERKEQLRKQQQREFRKSHPFHPTLVTKAHQREPAAAAFYDKIRMGNFEDSGKAVPWKATASVSSASASYRHAGATSPSTPLQTALMNARPSVRPIESHEPTRFYTGISASASQAEEATANMSRSSSSSQLLEDAELTSRVLAALDEKPTAASPLPTSTSCHTALNIDYWINKYAVSQCQKPKPHGSAPRVQHDDERLDGDDVRAVRAGGRAAGARAGEQAAARARHQLERVRAAAAAAGGARAPRGRAEGVSAGQQLPLRLPLRGRRVPGPDQSGLGRALLRPQDPGARHAAGPGAKCGVRALRGGPGGGAPLGAGADPGGGQAARRELRQRCGGATGPSPRRLRGVRVDDLRVARYDARNGEGAIGWVLRCWFVHCDDLDEEPPAPVVRSPSREKMRKEQAEEDWGRSSYQSGGGGYQNAGDGNRNSRFGRDDRYDSSGSSGGRHTSEWTEAGKDAQAYLRKQTEQAYDFAKKISIEDAKKGASETAKKAKKWGGSLLSSISATISSASSSVSKVGAPNTARANFGSCAPIRVEVSSRRNSLELQDEANRKSSAPYRAPELFEPTVDVALDGQSDVWSLGCVLYVS